MKHRSSISVGKKKHYSSESIMRIMRKRSGKREREVCIRYLPFKYESSASLGLSGKEENHELFSQPALF